MSGEHVLPCPRTYYVSDDNPRYRFDNSVAPVVTVASGDTVIVKCRDGSDGQLTPSATVETLQLMDRARIHAISGPIAVHDAEPGDVLKVELLEFDHKGWGWTSFRPGIGLLADDFGGEYAYHVWRAGNDGRAEFKPGIRVPIEEFCGVMGVAPAAPGAYSTMPPRRMGGNLDIRHLCRGSIAYFPIEVEGALFSIGDGHLAQGDGEVCGTAIEAPLTVTIRLSVVKDGPRTPSVQCETRAPTTSRVDGMGYFVTTSPGPSLAENARNAVRHMIDHLEVSHGLTRAEAYILCSSAGDLKIAVPVLGAGHAGNVTFQLPRSIFVA